MHNTSLQSTLTVIDEDVDKILEESFNALDISDPELSSQNTFVQSQLDTIEKKVIPQYSSLKDLITAKPKRLEDKMIPLLSALANATFIPIPYFPFAMRIKVDTIPLIENIINKHGFEAAIGFGRLAIQNVFQDTPCSKKTLINSQIYDVYNRILNIPVQFSDSEILKMKVGSFHASNALEKDVIDLSKLSDKELVMQMINYSIKIFIPLLTNDTPSKIIASLI